ncbi:hypothetical protein ACLB1S_26410 [Escherichia coli]
MNVKMVGTTDDPIILWSITKNIAFAKDGSFTIKCCRAGVRKAFNIEQATFNDYMAKLGRKFPQRHSPLC